MKGWKLLISLTALMLFNVNAQNVDVIKIALAAPMTGGNSAAGQQMLLGAQAAVDAANKAGGINGKQVKLIVGDDACDPKQAVSLANRLVDQDKVVGVVGHYCSSGTIPASEIYNDANVLMITPGSTNPTVTDRGLPNVLRTCGRDDQQGEVDAAFMKNQLKAKSIAVINDKDTYGLGVANMTSAKAKSLGIKVSLEDGLTRGEKDYNALVTRIKAAKVDAVFFGGLYAEAGLLLKQMRQQGLTMPFVTVDGAADKAFITAAGGVQTVKGTYMSFARDPRNNPDESVNKAMTALKAMGSDGAGFTLYTYAATQAVIAALKGNPGVFEGSKLGDWLKANQVDTVLGKKTWDKKGDPASNDYQMYVWNDKGEYVPLK